jgi:hypothetical protein
MSKIAKKLQYGVLESYDNSSKYLFITEGIFDIARVHESGYAVLQVLGK